jgi:bacterioferritin-associated ferredoxin
MIVCHCHRVCDRAIRAAVEAGASTQEAVTEMCGAGKRCGRCKPAVRELIERDGHAGSPGRSLSVLTSAA